MPANIGNQIVNLIYLMSATSANVNKRHQGIRQLGIYSGGRLTTTVSPGATLSPLICEISDGDYQVKVETTTAVSLSMALLTPYVVLRWTYTGASSDFMEVLQVAAPLANDLVVGKAIFVGPTLTSFEYGDTTYPRTTPNVMDLFLKVEPTEDTELKVRVRAGRIQINTGVVVVPDQKSGVFVAPLTNSKVYLVYITSAGLVAIDSSGTEAASPVPPSYGGKMVLAEVTLAATSTNITASMIKDVRGFISQAVVPDDLTIEKNSAGKLRIRCIENLTADPTSPIAGQIWIRTDL